MSAPHKPLMALEDALAQLLQAATPLASEAVDTLDADGRVLASAVLAGLNVPGFDNSAMDGYAVRSRDLPDAGVVLQVTQRIAAGQTAHALGALSAARIFTGAPIPAGADAVVMQEDCEVVNECEGGVRIKVKPTAGMHIRRAGEDIAKASVVLAAGTRLGPASLGLAASLGLDLLTVAQKPRVAIFSTGDELVTPGSIAPEALPAGHIFNSNRYFIKTLLERTGAVVTDYGVVPDQLAATQNMLAKAAAENDLVLTSGGVSVGEEDHVKAAVQSMGELSLWQISMKPGKPFAYGKLAASDQAASTYFIGLPGNPVSSFITFLLLVRPFLLRLQGATEVTPNSLLLPAHFDKPKADKRREFIRVKLNASGGLEAFANQSSGVLTSMVWASGLADIPADTVVKQGDLLRYLPFDGLWA